MPNGSDSALAMVAGANPLVGLAVIAGVGVVAAADFGYTKYEHYVEKKHLDTIKAIIAFYDQNLSNITLPDTGEKIAFPPIFKLLEEGGYDCLHFTDEQVKSLAKTALRSPDEDELAMYRQHIFDAINALKCYEFEHSNKTGVTVSVLQYLMNMLESRCMHFQGYSLDIAYLKALIAFIIQFAQMPGDDHSQHFTTMTWVYEELKGAEQELIKHEKHRSIGEMLKELLGTCRYFSDALLRGLVKVITPREHWDLVDFARLSKLNEGILRPEFQKRWGPPLTFWRPFSFTKSAIELPECRIRDWVNIESRYHIQSLDASVSQMDVPELESDPHFKGALTSREFRIFRQLFKDCKNFMTHTKIGTDFLPIQDDARITQRITLCADWAKLIDLLHGYQALLTKEAKLVENFGDLEAASPTDCYQLYVTHDDMCRDIRAQVDKVQTALSTNHLATQLMPDMDFYNSLEMALESIDKTIQSYEQIIKKRRDGIQDPGEETEESVRHDMIQRIQWLRKRNHYPDPVPLVPVSARDRSISQSPRPRDNVSRPFPEQVPRRHYPISYGLLFKTDNVQADPAYRQLMGIRKLLADYTKDDSAFWRFLTGHWNRHYVREVSGFIKQMDRELSMISPNNTVLYRTKVQEYLDNLLEMKANLIENKDGSLARRIDFIEGQCLRI